MRALLVEDNPAILAKLAGFLEPGAYVLDSTRNGYAGIVLASENTCDVAGAGYRLELPDAQS